MEENTTSTPPQKSGMSYSVYVVIIVVILLLLVGGMYLFTKKSPQTTQQPMMQPTQAMTAGTGAADTAMTPTNNPAAQKVTVTESNFTFSPKLITVKKGLPVAITVKNAEGTHDFVINEFNIKSQLLSSGQSQTLSFTPDKTGSFNYYCSVGDHRAMGMQGTLVVE